jgi:hypothetical protein
MDASNHQMHEGQWDNNNKLPHMGKEKLQRQGRLPVVFSCPVEAIMDASKSLEQGPYQIRHLFPDRGSITIRFNGNEYAEL